MGGGYSSSSASFCLGMGVMLSSPFVRRRAYIMPSCFYLGVTVIFFKRSLQWFNGMQ